MASAADAIAALSALATYRRRLLPAARRELRRWEAAAERIPDPVLRDQACSALREKGSNAEATAVFAILAPRARRAGALRAMTALQVAVDYLDTLGEGAADDPLADGLALHRALVDAVSPGGEAADWYALHPQREDGGYLAGLVAACREELEALPATEAVAAPLRRAARRCGEGQSHTHAAAAATHAHAAPHAGAHAAAPHPHPHAAAAQLEAWASRQQSPPGYLWWEVAAGASSSVAAHALIAAAADPRTGAEQGALIDAAYFPSIGALTVLLDDLLDRDADLAAAEHNYLSYCPSAAAASRMALLADRARAATAPLRHARRHRAILAGVAAFYLSAPAAGSGHAGAIRERLLESLGPGARPIMAAMRLRRRADRRLTRIART